MNIQDLNNRREPSIYKQEGLPTGEQTTPKDPFMEALKEMPQQALRYNHGKLQWSMVDFKSLEGMVRVLEMGAEKYSKDNWKLGMPVTQVCESLLRHLFSFMSGETNDQESGQSHMSHVMVNAMFIEYIMREKSQFDDRKKD